MKFAIVALAIGLAQSFRIRVDGDDMDGDSMLGGESYAQL